MIEFLSIEMNFSCIFRLLVEWIWWLILFALLFTFACHYCVNYSNLGAQRSESGALATFLNDALSYGKTKVGNDFALFLNVPKRYFQHFYFWGTFWNFGLTFAYFVIPTTSRSARAKCEFFNENRVVLFYLCLYQLHLTRRLYECLNVSIFGKESRMHVFQYVFGLTCYTLVPLTLIAFAERHDGRSFDFSISSALPVLLFFFGNYKQFRLHSILAKLRTNARGQERRRYFIPKSDWFEYVSSPHYLAEIIIYGSLFAGLRDQYSSNQAWISMILVIIVNLGFSAIQTHRWYKAKFDESYKKLNRRALIPFVL